ncbi:hypothetical protein [Klebsiella pneumoniae]|uniref:hypothetical protein n=1 Tax=Klebsiella pneumoniae TaxID=573 RepID=UPI00388E22D2
MAHDVPLGCAPDEYDDLISGTCSHLPYKNLHPENKTERQCTHTDGAIKVAEYILSEIKANVRSDTAETIRYLIDEDFIIKRLTEWNKLPFYARLGPPPKADLLAAMAIWYQTVKTGSI